MNPSDQKRVDELVDIVLQNLVGERSFVLDMTLTAILPRAAAAADETLHPIRDLPEVIGSMASGIVVGSDGLMAGI